jgi:hypothetical protein
MPVRPVLDRPVTSGVELDGGEEYHRGMKIWTLLLTTLGSPWAAAADPEPSPVGPPKVQEARKYAFEATAQEIAPSGKEPPGFLITGTTDLPDDYRIDIFTNFGVPNSGFYLRHDVAMVKNGKFSASLSLFKEANLAGEYSFRLLGEPDLQADRFASIPATKRDVLLKLGKPGEAEKVRAEISARLFSELKSLAAVAEEAATLRKSEKESGKTDSSQWERLLKDWYKRLEAGALKVQRNADYRVLGLSGYVDAGTEQVCGITMDIARCAARASDKDVREGRERLDLLLSKYGSELTGRPLDPKAARLELAQSARRFLAAGARSKEESTPPTGRNPFFQVLLNLNPLVSPEERQTLLEISAGARELFDAVDEKKEFAELLRKLDARLAALIQTFQNEK